MNPKSIAAASKLAELPKLDVESLSTPSAPTTARGWTLDIEALCRALDAQQRAHAPRPVEEPVVAESE